MTTLHVPSSLPARLIRTVGTMFTPFEDAERLCVLNYHRILAQPDPLLDDEPTVDTFRWQMRLVARYFNVLSLPDAIARLAAGRLPPRAICITFDDGYRSIHDLAMPVLKEFGLPATVFVSTAYLDSGACGTRSSPTRCGACRTAPSTCAAPDSACANCAPAKTAETC